MTTIFVNVLFCTVVMALSGRKEIKAGRSGILRTFFAEAAYKNIV